jgi:Hydrazine synthase alpha subunit middle domain
MLNSVTFIRSRLLPASALILSTLTACGGGGGGDGGNISLVSGDQSADPVVLEIPIAYIRRPLPEQPFSIKNPLAFHPGAQLLVRDRASATAEETDITRQIASIVAEETGSSEAELAIDIKGLESSFDGKTLVFAARVVPEPVNANLENTTWNLWVFDIESQQASYLIPSRIKRNEGMEAGGAQDIDPHFLPDDRIVFSSTRQTALQARLLNEGRAQIFSSLDEDGNQPAAVLHVYDPLLRGEEFQQISFNLSHDLSPTVLSTGEVVFSRWNNTAGDHVSLYRVDPSGAALAPLYGFHSRNSGTEGAPVVFTQVREMEDGRLASVIHRDQPDSLGGEIVTIDTANYADYSQGLWHNPGASGNGHSSFSSNEVRSDGAKSRGGQYGSLYPLHDGTGRLLVTWSECRVIDENIELAEDTLPASGDVVPCTLQPDNDTLAPPLYGAWVYDPGSDTQRPVVLAKEGFWVSEIIAAENRVHADLRSRDASYNAGLAVDNKGQLRIDSVYDLDGTDISPAGIANHARPGSAAFSNRPARFLRIVYPVPIPDRDVFEVPRFAFGVTTAFSFKEIAGYVPIEPDGSVSVNIPAQRAFSFDVLDQRGRRIGARHNYWLQLTPGEVLQCAGCHDHRSGLPHGLYHSQPASANPGARAVTGGGLGFANTDSQRLYATDVGQPMARTWDFHMPEDNPTEAVRQLAMAPAYQDDWHAPGAQPEASIDDRGYDPAWTDIPAERSLIAANLDPTEPGRIVINYIDHIQPIWLRSRTPVDDGLGGQVDHCLGCHNTQGDSTAAPGQLDLSALPSDQEPEHYRSYRELLRNDGEQWIDGGGSLADRQRSCVDTDDEGNELITVQTVTVEATMRAGSANGSSRFFACFEGGSCGPADAPALPDNCTEDALQVFPATRNTVDHRGMLSEAELHLLSEWLDIGAQYYNNPFDPRLSD